MQDKKKTPSSYVNEKLQFLQVSCGPHHTSFLAKTDKTNQVLAFSIGSYLNGKLGIGIDEIKKIQNDRKVLHELKEKRLTFDKKLSKPFVVPAQSQLQ